MWSECRDVYGHLRIVMRRVSNEVLSGYHYCNYMKDILFIKLILALLSVAPGDTTRYIQRVERAITVTIRMVT